MAGTAIRSFKSYEAAMKAVLPNSDTMGRIAKAIKKHITERIDKNKATGDPLKQITIDRKTRIGAIKPVTTKLREGGDLRDGLKETHDLSGCEIGWGSEKHKSIVLRSNEMTLANLAEVHHTGNGVPVRTVLEFDDDTDKVIENELRKRIIGVT